MFLCLFDHSGQVASSAVFHHNIEYASFSVDVSVVVSDYVFVVEVFEDISGRQLANVNGKHDNDVGRTPPQRSASCRARSYARS